MKSKRIRNLLKTCISVPEDGCNAEDRTASKSIWDTLWRWNHYPHLGSP